MNKVEIPVKDFSEREKAHHKAMPAMVRRVTIYVDLVLLGIAVICGVLLTNKGLLMMSAPSNLSVAGGFALACAGLVGCTTIGYHSLRSLIKQLKQTGEAIYQDCHPDKGEKNEDEKE